VNHINLFLRCFSIFRHDVYNIMNHNVRMIQLEEHITRFPLDSPKSDMTIEEEDLTEPFLLFSDIIVRASTIFYETDLTYAFVNIR
jgi:hypothetical protein